MNFIAEEKPRRIAYGNRISNLRKEVDKLCQISVSQAALLSYRYDGLKSLIHGRPRFHANVPEHPSIRIKKALRMINLNEVNMDQLQLLNTQLAPILEALQNRMTQV